MLIATFVNINPVVYDREISHAIGCRLDRTTFDGFNMTELKVRVETHAIKNWQELRKNGHFATNMTSRLEITAITAVQYLQFQL